MGKRFLDSLREANTTVLGYFLVSLGTRVFRPEPHSVRSANFVHIY